MDPDMSTGCKQEIRLETSEPPPTTGDILIQARSHLLPSSCVFAPARFNVLTPIGKALRLGRKYRNLLIAVDALSWLTAHWHRNPTFPSSPRSNHNPSCLVGYQDQVSTGLNVAIIRNELLGWRYCASPVPARPALVDCQPRKIRRIAPVYLVTFHKNGYHTTVSMLRKH